MSQAILDITRPIASGMPVWPGDPPVAVTRLGQALPALSQISLGSHSGTHVDAPAHFIAGGATVEQLPLGVLIGPAWVAHIAGAGVITAAQLASAGIPDGPIRLLLRTANSDSTATVFDPGFVALAPDAAAWLLDRGIELVGIDGPSIEPFDAPDTTVHTSLLGAGMVVVENLDLHAIPPGAYLLICLPLPIADGDGAPARVILINE